MMIFTPFFQAADRALEGVAPDELQKAKSVAEERDQIAQRETERILKYADLEWDCLLCYCKNKAIHYGNQLQQPPDHCYLCGKRRGSTPDPKHERLSVTSRADREFKEQTKLGRQYMEMRKRWKNDEKGNKCGGIYVDRCPKVQLLVFIMRCYNYNIGRECECDQEDDEQKEPPKVESMYELIETLPDLGLQRVIQCYEHVINEHKEDETLYDHFEDQIGSCHDKQCEFMMRSLGRRAICIPDQASLNSAGTSASLKSSSNEKRFSDTAGETVNATSNLPETSTVFDRQATSKSITIDISEVAKIDISEIRPSTSVGQLSPLTITLKPPTSFPENQSATKPTTTNTLNTLR